MPLDLWRTDARALTQTLARYRAPNLVRSIVELIITPGR